MAKILILNVPAHGHVNPTLALTKALVDEGHEVTYLVTEEFRSKIEATGAIFKTYKFDTKNPYSYENVRSAYDSALKLAEDCDCLIYEFMFFLGDVIGDKINKPTVRLCSSFAWTRKISADVFSNCDNMKLKLLEK